MDEEIQPTGKAVVEFLTAVANRGDMNSATAAAMRAAVKEVLESVEGDAWEGIDVSKVDLDRYASRFATKRAQHYKSASLRIYQSRFKNAVSMFLEWRKDPAAWTYTAERPYAERKARRQQKQPEPSGNGSGSGGRLDSFQIPQPDGVEMVDYPFVVRPGVFAKLTVPADLRGPEAARLQAFIGTLPMEERPALARGEEPS